MDIAGEPGMGLSRVLLSLALGGVVAGLGIVGGRPLGEQSALAADPITVNSTADGTLTNLAENTTCDLREAIVAANTDAQVGQCNVGGGDAATITITSTGTVLLTANLPPIKDAVIINGPGADSLTIEVAPHLIVVNYTTEQGVLSSPLTVSRVVLAVARAAGVPEKTTVLRPSTDGL